jgi:hypothetical protein
MITSIKETKMKKARLFLSAAALLAIALSLTSPFGARSAVASEASQTTVPVYTTPDGFLLGDPVPGANATLLRNKNGITTNVNTFVTAPGAYTVWWVVFNHPQACQTYLCTYDEPDFVTGATGHPVSPSEIASLSARLNVGGPYNNEILYEGPDPGLTNPSGALILLVIRYHGTELAGGGSKQFRRFLAGCPEDGAPCQDVQLAVFPGDCSGLCLVPFP